MSMSTYPCSAYGARLDFELERTILKAANEPLHLGLTEADFSDENVENTFVDAFEDDIGRLGDFDGAFYQILKDGQVDYDAPIEEYDDVEIVYVPLQRGPNFFKAAYKDIAEMEAEIRSSRVGKFIPADYPIVVGEFWGTVFC